MLANHADPRTFPSAGDEHQIGHVHGLGVDPVDDTLYVAGHFGVFRVDADGVPTRIADRRQDTMAFTVTGPGTFLASGHPDPREDLPAHLGLIESTDAGETWQTLADGQFVDLAVTPAQPDRVVATTSSGAVHEIGLDGAARTIPSAPALTWIDARSDGGLVGITGEGELFTATGPDEEWQQVGRIPGTPAALEVTDSAWYAATEDSVHTSTDGGATWSVVVGAPD